MTRLFKYFQKFGEDLGFEGGFVLAIIVYGSGKAFPLITPGTFVLVYNPHWIDFPRYMVSSLYPLAEVELQTMITLKKRTSRPFVASDIEIKKILGNLGSGFTAAYSGYKFSVSCAAMLGMQLFKICVDDRGFNWWYKVPKPLRGMGHYEHSEYHL